ncbi:dihydrofolate reductase [bacterium]|nr:dihydrofolate reductase [bacterium]
MIRVILACDQNWGIGKDGGLPWPHNSADMKWFKNTTTGCVVVMGKSTWDSLPVKPLPNRNNIVVTSSELDKDKGGYHYIKFDNAITEITNMSKLQNVWIIGGAKLVMGLFPIIDEFHLSRISGSYDCDTFLPSTLIEENFTLRDSGITDGVYVDVWSKL